MASIKSSNNKSSLKANIATAVLVVLAAMVFLSSGIFGLLGNTTTKDGISVYTAKCQSYSDILDEQSMALCESEAFFAELHDSTVEYELQTVKVSIAVLIFAIAIFYRFR